MEVLLNNNLNYLQGLASRALDNTSIMLRAKNAGCENKKLGFTIAVAAVYIGTGAACGGAQHLSLLLKRIKDHLNK